MTPGRPAALLALLAVLLPVAAASAAAAPQRTWHADQARVPDARSAGRDGDGVLVAVLDSWVDAAHPDFEGRVAGGADCTSGSCLPGPPAADPCTHGTHVAGTVASSSYGVAPRARVLPVKVLGYADGQCSGSDRAVAAGIRYAVAQGARVLNLSLGTLVPGLSSSSAIAGAVRAAADAGAVVVFAAGNSSLPLADSYGGAALIVAATGPDGTLAGYSQRGLGVSLAAPGGDPGGAGCTPATCVTSLYPGGRYAVAAGTSMAAPHVAGIAALLLAQDPSRTRQDVVDRLRATARPVPGGGAGAGLVDATAALSGGPGAAPTATTPTAAGVPAATVAPPSAAATAVPPPQRRPAPTAARQGSAGPAVGPLPAGTLPAAPAAPGQVVAPEVLLAGPSDPGVEQPAAAPDPSLPSGPPVLAGVLLLVAAVSTALTRRQPVSSRRSNR